MFKACAQPIKQASSSNGRPTTRSTRTGLASLGPPVSAGVGRLRTVDVNLFSWRKKTHQLDALCWNLMVAATDPDRCWDMASTFRKTAVPGSVLTCETSFLMGSIVRDVIRSKVAGDKQRQCVMSAESAYFKNV